MNLDGGNAGVDALIFFILSLAIAWLIVYTAVRAAAGHALDRTNPRLVAEATATPDGVQFAVLNSGNAPAVDVTVRWFAAPGDAILARAQLLGIDARLEWTVPVAAMPDETAAVRWLVLGWAPNPDPSPGASVYDLPRARPFASERRALIVIWQLGYDAKAQSVLSVNPPNRAHGGEQMGDKTPKHPPKVKKPKPAAKPPTKSA